MIPENSSSDPVPKTLRPPFHAIEVVNTPEQLKEIPIHKFGKNGFVLFRLPYPMRGEVVGLLGPNGAGKTTMMRLIMGFFPPTEGTVRIDGSDLVQAKPVFRRKIGYLAENNPLYHDMLACEFLSYVATIKGISNKFKKKSISRVAEQCGVESVLKRQIGVLSKGYQQRIGLAQALLGEPEILILDEPTTGLDPKQIIEIRTLIQKLGSERTILLSTHVLPEVRMTCQRILILNEGRLVASGTAEDLEGRLKGAQEFTAVIRGSWPHGDDFIRLVPGVLEVKLERENGDEREYLITSERGNEIQSQVARKILDAGFELLTLKPTEWNLEDIFLKIVTRDEEMVTA